MSTPFQPRIPRRQLLTDQAAQCIRERIHQGEWVGELPAEAVLCRELQVSRVTLRRALHALEEDGHLVNSGRGMRRKINAAKARGTAGRSGRIVRVLSPFSHWKTGAVHHAVLEGLAHRVDSHNLRVVLETRPQLFRSHRPRELERLIELPDTVGWVLFFSTGPMQRWFAESGIPCVVAGRLFEDFDLPCAHPDNEAVARHAAGLLVARGHRQLAYLIARQTSLGDRLASEAFRDESATLGAHPRIVEYAGGPESVCRAMESLLASKPAPTACYLTCPEDAVTVLCHALRRGISVPGQLDILVGWDDPVLESTVPALTHYRFDGARMGRKIGSLILQRIENRQPKPQQTRFLGEFFPGGTLKPATGR